VPNVVLDQGEHTQGEKRACRHVERTRCGSHAAREDVARVTFIFAKANDGFFATTKKNGEFSAKDIKGGEWRVQVDAPNFITVRQTLTISDSKNPPLAMQLKRDNSPEFLVKAEGLFKAGQNTEARTEYMTVLAAHPELTAINRAIAFT
jgi:hypothetical protein